jgi:hypothetical protein
MMGLFFFMNQSLVICQEGEDAAAFLELGIGGRSLAMGSAFVAVADDGTAFYWNPAGSSTLMRAELAGMYASLFNSLEKQFHIGFTRPLYGAGAISLNWVRLAVTDIPAYDSNQLYNGSSYAERIAESSQAGGSWGELKRLGTVLTDDPLGFSQFNNDAFIINIAKMNRINLDFGWQYFVLPVSIPIGLNVKLIRQSLFQKKSSGVGFDFGTMIKFGIDDLFDDSRLGKFAIGFAWKDIFNTKITWDTDTRHADKVKSNWHLGTSYFQPIPGISSQLFLAYEFKRKYAGTHHVGAEYVYNKRLAIRFGLDDAQFTAGVGIWISLFRFDYAFMSHELGGNHRISTFIQL